MNRKLKLSHLKAWDYFMMSHSETLRKIEKDLESTISFTWYEILFLVNSSENHRIRMTDLADMLVLSKSALTRAIDSLVKVGYIKRVNCAEDGRVSYAAMTTKGHASLKSAWPIFRSSLQKHFGSKLSIQDAKNLEQILKKLAKARD
jgi:DNA-binding MarR family transcriptional regulator